MPRVIEKLAAFVRWLIAPEELPGPAESVPDGRGGARPGFTQWVLHNDPFEKADAAEDGAPKARTFLGWVLSGDALPHAAPGVASSRLAAPRFWQWLLSGEEVPVVAPTAVAGGARTKFFTRLMAADSCPRSVVESTERRKGFCLRLLASERCPVAPAPASSARKGFVRWVLAQDECPASPTPGATRHQGFWRKLFASEEL